MNAMLCRIIRMQFMVLLSGVNGRKELLKSKVSGARYGELMLTHRVPNLFFYQLDLQKIAIRNHLTMIYHTFCLKTNEGIRFVAMFLSNIET